MSALPCLADDKLLLASCRRKASIVHRSQVVSPSSGKKTIGMRYSVCGPVQQSSSAGGSAQAQLCTKGNTGITCKLLQQQLQVQPELLVAAGRHDATSHSLQIHPALTEQHSACGELRCWLDTQHILLPQAGASCSRWEQPYPKAASDITRSAISVTGPCMSVRVPSVAAGHNLSTRPAAALFTASEKPSKLHGADDQQAIQAPMSQRSKHTCCGGAAAATRCAGSLRSRRLRAHAGETQAGHPQSYEATHLQK